MVAVLLIVGVGMDWRERRRGRRIDIDGADAAEIRAARRDVRAWERGSTGHCGEDVSWMGRFWKGKPR